MSEKKKLGESVGAAVQNVKNNKKATVIIIIAVAAVLTAAVVTLTHIVLSGMDFSTVAHIDHNFWLALLAALPLAAAPLFKTLAASNGFASGELPFKNALSSYYIGKALDLVLPFKLGEAARFKLCPAGSAFSSNLAISFISLLLDGVFLLIYLLVGGLALVIGKNHYITGDAVFSDYWLSILLVVFIMVAALFAVALIMKPSRELIKKFFKTDRWLRSVIFAAVGWLLKFAAFVLSFSAFGNVGFFASLAPAAVAMALSSACSLIPATPAQLGLFELTAVFSFVAAGYTAEQGLLAGLWMHGAYFVGILPVAAVVWLLFGRRILKASADNAAKKEEKAPESAPENETAEAVSEESEGAAPESEETNG